MARQFKTAVPAVMRCDLLPSNLTASKDAQVRDLLVAYQSGAVMLAREQWRLFFETGRFNKNHDIDKMTFAAVIGAANRVQMCRWQVVGQLQSWLSNRANEFRLASDIGRLAQTLGQRAFHMTHCVNAAKSAATDAPSTQIAAQQLGMPRSIMVFDPVLGGMETT